MTFDELNNQIAQNSELFSNKIEEKKQLSGEYYSINNLVAIKIFELNSRYKHSNPITVYNEGSDEIGTIYYLDPTVEKVVDEISEWLFVAYLKDVSIEELENFKYNFKGSYLVLKEEYFEDYLTSYYETAPLWGMLTHDESHTATDNFLIETITVKKDLQFPTGLHINNSIRVLKQPFHFERFLKLYHHLELLYDKIVVDEIKSLNEENLTQLGKLIKSFDDNECKKLLYVLKKKVTNIQEIVEELNKIVSFKDLAKEIFFEFGKKDNDPFSNDYSLFEKVYNIGFTEENCKRELGNRASNPNNPEQYTLFILKLAAYWIYRVRCSIAHNKIGEFIFKEEDENFIIEFAEPLLNTIIMQVFKNS